MRRKFTMLWAVVAISLLFVSCGNDDDDNESYLGSLTVKLELKEGLSDIELDDVDAVLVNIQDNTEREAESDDNGILKFENLPAGNYNLNVSESREDGAYTLTGTMSSISIAAQEDKNITVEIDAVVAGADFVIKEVYYVGAGDNYASLFKDQFIEIFNNSGETLYADGLHVASLYGQADDNADVNYATVLDIEENVYAEFIYVIPGNGTEHPVEPGKSIVICLNAMNFKESNMSPDMAQDLTGADFELYSIDYLVERGRDASSAGYWDFNNPDVPNVELAYLNNVLSFPLIDIYGPGIVIFRPETEIDYHENTITYTTVHDADDMEYILVPIPVESIIDGVEILKTSNEGDWKRIPSSIDASFHYINPDALASYTSESSVRKVDEEATRKLGRVVLMDTNNSYNDFEVVVPATPRGYDNYVIE